MLLVAFEGICCWIQPSNPACLLTDTTVVICVHINFCLACDYSLSVECIKPTVCVCGGGGRGEGGGGWSFVAGYSTAL